MGVLLIDMEGFTHYVDPVGEVGFGQSGILWSEHKHDAFFMDKDGRPLVEQTVPPIPGLLPEDNNTP